MRLSPALWKKWQCQNPDARTTFETFRYPVGDPVVYEIAWAPKFQLGDILLQNVDVGLIPGAGIDKALDNAGKEFVAALGIRALQNLRMIVHVGGKEVLTQSVSPYPGHNRLGAVFLPEPGGGEGPNSSLLAKVLDRSPAERAGIHDGDKLVSINGVDYSEGNRNGKRPEPFFTLPAGTVLKIELERDSDRLKVEVRLEELLP